jgi:hypothetical protein
MKAKALLTHPPEIEQRRTEYKSLAESLINMARLQSETTPSGLLDIRPPGWVEPEPEDYIFFHSIEDHLRALFENLLAVYDDDFMRGLYVELRLYYDERMLEFKAGEFQHRGKKVA